MILLHGWLGSWDLWQETITFLGHEFRTYAPDFLGFVESGHFPMIDEPSKFNRLLSDFLNLEAGESPHHLQIKDKWKRRVR